MGEAHTERCRAADADNGFGGGSTFTYDYAGNRVKKNLTVYIGELCTYANGVYTNYIFGGGQRIASKKGSTVYYYHGDHLGSSNIITDTAGNKVEEIHYYPFGAARSDTGTINVPYKYTDQEFDAETGLYNYNARLYDQSIGRFISPDTIVPDYGSPQSLNRYSYALNNPLRYVDPSGHDPVVEDMPADDYSQTFIPVDPIGEVNSTLQCHVDPHRDGVENAIGGFFVVGGLLGAFAPELEALFWVYGNELVYGSGVAAGGAIASAVEKDSFAARGATAAAEGVGLGGRAIKLADGFYQAEGSAFKFSQYYYEKLWATGRGAPFVQAQEILSTARSITPDRMAGFYRYTNGFMEMVYNPTTKEVWHMMPLK